MHKPLLPFLGALLVALTTACSGGKNVAAGGHPPDPTEITGEPGAKDKRAHVTRLFMEATQARLKGDLGRAVQLYNATLKADPTNAASMFELSKLYHAAQHGNEAMAMAKRAVATDKENIWYRFLLADLSTQLGDLPGAAKAYQDILTKWPERYEVYFGLANVLSAQGKTQEASKVFRELEERTGSNPELVMREFDMLAGAGRLQDAKALLERAIVNTPNETQYYGMLAQVYDELGDSGKALEMYERALALDPDDSMTRVSLAQYYYDAGKQDQAFAQLREAFADPDLDIDPKMQLLLGIYSVSDGKDSASQRIVQESHALIQVLKKAHPQSGKPWSIEGDYFLREGRNEEARSAFRKALEFEQDKFPIWSALLQLDLQLQDYQATHQDAEKAIELFPTQPEFHLFNGIALSQLKKHPEAIDALVTGRDLVVDNDPMLHQFWSSLGDAYNAAGRHADSDKAYDRALAMNANDPTVLNNYAYYLSERGEKLEKAEAMSRKAIDLEPGVATYLDTYAWVLYKMGRLADARTWQEKALAAAGGATEGTLLEHYGDILFKLGDKEGALVQWKKAQGTGDASDLIDRKVGEGRLVE